MARKKITQSNSSAAADTPRKGRAPVEALAAIAAKRARQLENTTSGSRTPDAAAVGPKRRRHSKSPEQVEDKAQAAPPLDEHQADGSDSESVVSAATEVNSDLVHQYADALVADAKSTGVYRTSGSTSKAAQGPTDAGSSHSVKSAKRSKKQEGPSGASKAAQGPTHAASSHTEQSGAATAQAAPPREDLPDSAEHQEAADAAAGPATPAEAAELDGKKGAKQRQETIAVLNDLGIKLDGTLKEKIQQYCRAMIEQNVDVLKKIYLPTLFSHSEMSTLWQMLKGWIAKASPKTQAKWKEICKTPMSHCGSKGLAKMAVLNLALVRQCDWEELLVEVTSGVKDEESKKSEGKWLYKSELERKVGKQTAKRWIRDGKWEEGEDSDGEAVYRKVQKSDATVRTKSTQANVKKTAALDKEEFETLTQEMAAMFEDDAGPGRVKKHQAKIKDGAGQSKSSAQKASEALKGDGEAPLTLALLDAPIDPESKAREVEAKNKAKKCSAKLNDKIAELESIRSSIGKKPTRMQALVLQEASELRLKMVQQQKLLNKIAAAAVDKVHVADSENACAEVTKMLIEAKEIKRHAKAASPAPLPEPELLD